ncbi:MAG: hypothetical protein ABIO43_04295 [Sphingomicrobium sp.]
MRTFWNTKLTAIALGVAIVGASPALGHGSTKPRHGGQVEMSGETLVELVRGAKGVSVFVRYDDDPVPASDLTGKLVVTQGTKKFTSPLVAGTANRLDARGVKIPSGAKVAVMLVTKSTQSRSVVNFTAK